MSATRSGPDRSGPRGGGRTGRDAPPRRVVVTGVGPITASGIGREGLWEGLRRARSPIREITRFDASPFRSRIAAEIDGFDPDEHMDPREARRLDRYGQLTRAAVGLALDDAGLDPATVEPKRGGVRIGSALGGISMAEHEVVRFHDGGTRAVNPRLALTVFPGAASCGAAIQTGFTGPNSTNSMSCASGTIAVGEAWRDLREGRADVSLAGGVEAPLAPLSFGAFSLIRAMSTRNDEPAAACRPFDRHRDGFVMGEGACVLVLEERGRALERGAPIYCEVLGYGTTNDAHHMTAPLPGGSEAARAMRLALEAAGVDPGRVGYVNAHGSSTPLNDSTESVAIRAALGDSADRTPVSGTKPYYGHALGASGAIEAGICALVLRRGWIPPTLNLETRGEDCDLDYVDGEGRDVRPEICVSNSFGFGGINASLVLGAP